MIYYKLYVCDKLILVRNDIYIIEEKYYYYENFDY